MKECGDRDSKLAKIYRFEALSVTRTKPFEAWIQALDISGAIREIVLCGQWTDCVPLPGDRFNVVCIRSTGEKQKLIVDDSGNGFYILHPDTLVSATSVATSSPCLRRSTIQAAFALNSNSVDSVKGTLAHEVFQDALRSSQFDVDSLRKIIHQVCIRKLLMIESVQLSLLNVENYLIEAIPMIQRWAKTYLKSVGGGIYGKVQVESVLDIEDTIWSPSLGLKGKIDATFQVNIPGKQSPQREVIPFELKTGYKSNHAHVGQVMLYSLMMSFSDEESGLLCYLNKPEMSLIQSNRAMMISLLSSRNQIAKSLVMLQSEFHNFGLPPMMKSEGICRNCYVKESCFMLHQTLEDGNADSSGVPDSFKSFSEPYSPEEVRYFRQWIAMIDREYKHQSTANEEIWNHGLTYREKQGHCVYNLRFIKIELPDETQQGADSICLYTFQKEFSKEPCLISLTLDESVAVTLQEENQFQSISVFTAFVHEINADSGCIILRSATRKDSMSTEKLYRIDRYAYDSICSRMKGNLMKLFGVESSTRESAKNLRKILFDSNYEYALEHSRMHKLSSNLPDDILKDFERLNQDQKLSILNALSSKEFSLILGMPGTGKTSTLVVLIRILIYMGNRVLVMSHTNSAVDNIMRKLLEFDAMSGLRVGSMNSIANDIKSSRFAFPRLETFEPPNSVLNFLSTIHVFGTTCLGITNLVFENLEFDFCIVDEASQILEPVTLGGLLKSKKFVLVGDHYQLPPLVKLTDFDSKKLMGSSLFKRLSQKYPQALTSLSIQYRMNSDIMFLCNSLIYCNQLRCASPEIALQKLEFQVGMKFPYSSRNLSHTMFESILGESASSVLFVDYGVINTEQKENLSFFNPVEASIVFEITRALVESGGLAEESIGVISPYRPQLKVLRSSLCDFPAVEVQTIDQYQGRDKDCIIISTVRSNSEGESGELLKDWRRINVAITRAKKKLIFVGDIKTVRSSSMMNDLISVCAQKGWIIRREVGSEAACTHLERPEKRRATHDLVKQD